MSNIERACKAVLIAISILALVLGGWITIRRLAELEQLQDFWEVLLIYLLPLAAIAICCTAAALSSRVSSALALIYCGSVFSAFFAAELYLQVTYFDSDANLISAARRHGNENPDLRSAYEVVRDMRRKRNDVHPFFRLLSRQEKAGLVPLGNTPNRTIVYCNELGRYLIFRSDRFGFNNPEPVWDRDSSSVVLIGDSFAQGACDPQNNGFANILRETYPDLVNVGVGGNDPLANLATLVEYAVKRRPKVVVWAHYAGNDLAGLEGRKSNQILRKYVTPGFSQDLYTRAVEVESVMSSFFKRVVEPALLKDRERRALWQQLKVISILKLQFLRQRLGLTKQLQTEVDWELFEQIMLRAQQESDTVGARFIFVSLPDAVQVLNSAATAWEKKSFEILKRLGIEHYDLRPALRQLPDPSQAYAFESQGGHFSPAGSRLAADAIREIIERSP